MSSRGLRGRMRGGATTRSSDRSNQEEEEDHTPPTSNNLQRHESTMSDVSTTSSAAGAPDCLLCCMPIQSYCIATCQHSAQICSTCIMRVKLFINKKKQPEAAPPNASSSSAAAAAVPAPAPAASSSADLLNEDTDTRISYRDNPNIPLTPAQQAEQESKQMKCPYCHQDWSRVLITREYDGNSAPPSASFGLSTDSKYNIRQWIYDPKLNVYFENEHIKSKYFMMTNLYCVLCYNLHDAFSRGGNPSKKYSHVHMFLDQAQLEQHLEQKHQRYLCSACMTTRKIFIHEHQVFTRKELNEHFKYGTNASTVTEYKPAGGVPGVIEPHSFCAFCEKPFFSNDELYAHLISQHKSCRFCVSEGFNRYFRTDAALRSHFAQKHYLCEEGKCRRVEANYAAFRDVFALRAHRLAAHTEGLSKEEIKRIQTIDLDSFHREPRRGHQHGQAGGRRHEIEEFEFRFDEPQQYGGSNNRSSSNSSSFDVADFQEDFPTLGGGGGSASASSSARAPIHRSASLPQFSHSFTSEEAFPALGGSSSTTSTGLRAPVPLRGAPQALNAEEFPTLRSVVKAEAKQAKKQQQQQQQQHQLFSKKAATPPPSSATASTTPTTQDNRTVSSVPLPLPPPPPAHELPARNKSLVAGVKAALQQDAVKFEAFKTASGSYRSGDLLASEYLDAFEKLLAANPSGSNGTELLLMDLIATLPDASQRQALHGEYAKRKIMKQVQGLKGKLKSDNTNSTPAPATARPATAASSTSSSSAIAKSATPTPTLASTLASSSSASSSSSSSSSSVTSKTDDFRTVQSKEDRKASQSAAKKAAAAQGIASFEGRSVKPLKEKDAEPEDFLSIIAKEKEVERLAALEREAEKERERLEANRLTEAPKKGWGAATATAAPSTAPASRGPPGFGPKMAKQNSWTALADDDGTEEVRQKADKKKHAPTSYPRTASPDRTSIDDSPPLSVVAASQASSGPLLPEAETVDQHFSTIEDLRIPAPSKSKLQLLVMMFHEAHQLIGLKHGSINAPPNRRFHLTPDARSIMMTLIRQTRFHQVWDFSRLGRLGLTPNSIQALNSLTGMYSRYGGDMVGDSLTQAFNGMSSQELFMLVEFIHHLLLQITKPTHPDMKELLANFAKDEERLASQNERFKAAVAITPKHDDMFERSNKSNTPSNEDAASSSAQPKKKKEKKVLLRLG